MTEQLRALAEAERRVEPPLHLEAQILAQWDTDRREREQGIEPIQRSTESPVAAPRSTGWRSVRRGARQEMLSGFRAMVLRRWPVAAALAAGVIVGAAVTLTQLRGGTETPTIDAVPVSESVVLVVEPPGVQESVRVVRIRVARSALESLGIQTFAAQGAESVEVDVLVGEDGVARGVRLAM